MTLVFNDLIEERLKMFNTYIERSHMEKKTYQYAGVKWCLMNELNPSPLCSVRGGFIADEMGLGKTITMIGTFLCNFAKRTLIVLPPVLIDQWFIQIYRTTGHKAMIYHGEDKKKITVSDLKKATIVLTTYSAISLTKKTLAEGKNTLLHRVKWSRIVFDEAHHLRNSKTSRYIGARRLKANIRWLVSGTPVQNKKDDFYSLCRIIQLPASFYTEATNLSLLAGSFILKRTKKQVGIQIPDVILEKKIVQWTNRREMELSEEIHSAIGFSRVTEKKNTHLISNIVGKGSLLALMLRARQSCILPKLMTTQLNKVIQAGLLADYSVYKEAFNHSSKLDSVAKEILERKDNDCGKLIFCHFREEIDEIANRLRAGGMTKIATFDGRTTNRKRFSVLNEKNEALILQIQTGCEGLNLQENYSEIYFISPHWNPAVEDQAIARCHRIGQTKEVFVKRFEMGTFLKDDDQEIEPINVENYVCGVQDYKRNIARDCIDV